MSKEVDMSKMTPIHVAVYGDDYDTLANLFKIGVKYPPYEPGTPSPLAIAVQEPTNYRMITLLCLHGADFLTEVSPEHHSNTSLLIAAQLNTVGETPADYVHIFTCVSIYMQTILMLNELASGRMTLKDCEVILADFYNRKLKWCEATGVHIDAFDTTAKGYLQTSTDVDTKLDYSEDSNQNNNQDKEDVAEDNTNKTDMDSTN